MAPVPQVGQSKDELDTPVLLIGLDAFESNMQRLAGYCRDHGTGWRPHSKAHKCPDIAHLQMAAGALGVTCAKLSEAEVMVEHGITEILIANEIVTPSKHRRLAALQRRARVLSAVDNPCVIESMAASAAAEAAALPLVVDVDIGMDRTGCEPGGPALELARRIGDTPGLQFDGLMGYEGHVLDIEPPEEKTRECHRALDLLLETRDLLEQHGIPVNIISAGGTGCYRITAAYPGITEVQAGGGIFMDNMYRRVCSVDDLDLALTVLTTVTSRHPGHVVTDAGFKTLSAFHEAPSLVGRDDMELRYLSAEHGTLDLKPGCPGPEVGERLELVVGYSDSTNVLHDRFVGMRGNRVETVWDILGRGMLT